MHARWTPAAGLALLLAASAHGQSWPPPEFIQAIPEELKATTHALDTTGEPKVHMPSGDHTADRAGYPGCVRAHAKVTNLEHGFCGGWVGGSAGIAKRGVGPVAGDGTWGWDLVGHRHYHNIFLNFLHDKPHQLPGGPYEANSPTVYDVFSYRPLVQIREKKKEAEGHEE